MADDFPPRAETPVSPLYSAFPLPASRVSSLQTQRLSNRSDGLAMTTMTSQSSRRQAMSPSPSNISISSFSTSSAVHQPATPTNVYPPPAYVASFGATQAVSERKRRFSDDEDDYDSTAAKPAREDVHFSVASLALLNGFLDQLLYSILLHARSTTLTALRPAVTEVLRSRLASEAIESAEEELSELLAGGAEEEEEMNQRQSSSERTRNWDTELVWKRTRLRVMVYTRLGEMEDDNEERYVREDELFQTGDHRFSSSAGLVPWAAAIFLTSVLEYVAEQLLQVAAQAADTRARRLGRHPHLTRSASDLVTPEDGDYLIVEEHDMDRLALHKSAGRLWRTWKKTLRSTAVVSPLSPDHTNGFASRGASKYHINGTAMSPPESVDGSQPAFRLPEDDRDVSEGTDEDEIRYPEYILAANIPLPMEDEQRDIDEIQYAEDVLAANIPLPMEAGRRDIEEIQYPEDILAATIALPMKSEKQDIDEIEVPGLAGDPEAADKLQPPEVPLHRRRSSWAGLVPLTTNTSNGKTVPTSREAGMASAHTPIPEQVPEPRRMSLRRARSSSLPMLLCATNAHTRDEPQEVTGAATRQVQPERKVNATEGAGGAPNRAAVPKNDDVVADAHHSADSAEKTLQNSVSKAESGSVAPYAAGVASAATGLAHRMPSGERTEGKEQHTENSEGIVKSSESEETVEQPNTPLGDGRESQKALKDLMCGSVPTGQMLKRRSMGTLQLQLGSEDVPRMAKRMSLTQAVLVRRASSKDLTTRPWVGDNTGRGDMPAVDAPQGSFSEPYQSQGSTEERIARIGVARASGTVVSTPTEGEPAEGLYHARDGFTPRRHSRVLLSDSPVSSTSSNKSSPPMQQEDDDATPTLSPESFLQGRSLSAKNMSRVQKLGLDVSHSAHNQARSPAPMSPIRTSAADSLATVQTPVSPVSDRTPSPWRQLSTAAIKDPMQLAPVLKKPSSSSESMGPVQEHPALQKMATRSQASLKEPESSQPLTSASIRGPEDFEMFVQGGDTVKYTLTPESVRGDPVSLHCTKSRLGLIFHSHPPRPYLI